MHPFAQDTSPPTLTAGSTPNEARERAYPAPGPWVWCATGYALLYAVVRATIDYAAHKDVFDFLTFLPFSVAQGVILFLAASRSRHPALRRGLRAYGLSATLTSVGALWSYYASAQLHTDPVFGWANWPYLLSYPAAALGLLSLPTAPIAREGRLRVLVDSCIAVIAAVTLTWIVVVQPLAAAQPDLTRRVILYAYPIGDLILFALVVPFRLGLRKQGGVGILRVLGSAQLAYLAGDLVYQLVSDQQFSPNFVVAEGLYIAGYIGMIWAGEAAARNPASVNPTIATAAAGSPPRNLLPLALALVVYAVLLSEAFRRPTEVSAAVAVASVAVTLLILLRESLTKV